jgi:hypothetical protein
VQSTVSNSGPASDKVVSARSRWLITGILLAGALSAITGVISYNHGLTVARETGNTGMVAYLVPLVPDLMIAMSSLVLFVASTTQVPRPKPAMAALVAGIGWTVAQNVAAGWHQGAGGRTLDAGIPLAFVLTFESLLWLFRRGRGGASQAPVPAASSHDQPVQPPTAEAALAALLAADSERRLAEFLRVDRNRVQGWKRQLAEVAEQAAPDPSVNGHQDA